MEDFETCSRKDFINKHLISSKDALYELPEVVVSEQIDQKIKNGVHITLNDLSNLDVPKMDIGQQLKIISCRGSLVGVVESLVNEDIRISGNDNIKAWKTLRVFLN
jgi:tRNA U55 pseudouridine synthase TruB